MAYVKTVVYPLKSSSQGTLAQGNNKFLNLNTLTLDSPYTITTAQGVYGKVTDNGSPANPIPGAYVALKSSNSIVMVKTDDNGMYSLGVQTAGTYQLNIIANGYDIYTNDSVQIESNTYESLGTTALTSDAELDTAVSKAIIGTFKDQPTQAAIANAVLTLYDTTTTPTVVGLTVTNSSGEFAFAGLNGSKTYKIVAASLDHTIVEVPNITFTSDTFKTISIQSDPLATTNYSLIQGKTDDEGNDILPNTTVILYQGTSPNGTALAYTKSNNDGYYVFTVANAGSDTGYYVKATNNIDPKS